MAPARGVQLDELDLRIIGALRLDGRRPVADLARELDVPKSTVQRRLDALIRERVIRFAVLADSARLGLNLHAQLNLNVDLAYYQAVIDAIRELTEVHWLAVTTGPKDLVAEGYFASATHLHEFIREKLAPITGINSIETSVILSVEKVSFHWDALLREAAQHMSSHVRFSASPDPSERAERSHLGDAVTTHTSVTYSSDARCRSPGQAAAIDQVDSNMVGTVRGRDS